MAGKINSELSDDLVKLLGEDGLSSLSDENADKIIESLKKDKEKGWFGQIFGTNPVSSVMYITLTICICLMIIGVLVLGLWNDFASEYWQLTFPVITGALGYMYGKNTK